MRCRKLPVMVGAGWRGEVFTESNRGLRGAPSLGSQATGLVCEPWGDALSQATGYGRCWMARRGLY